MTATFSFTHLSRLCWAIATLLVPAIPLTIAAAGPGVLPGDVAVSGVVHDTLPAWFSGPVAIANLLGLAPVAIGLSALISALLFSRRWFTEAALVSTAALAWIGNAALKTIAESPRPTANLVRISEHADGFGFPSGHVMGVTVLFGALFVIATTRIHSRYIRHLAQGAAIAMLVLTGIARIEVGAHWPSDVLGGYLWGTILLLSIVTAQANWPSITVAASSLGQVAGQLRQIVGAIR